MDLERRKYGLLAVIFLKLIKHLVANKVNPSVFTTVHLCSQVQVVSIQN